MHYLLSNSSLHQILVDWRQKWGKEGELVEPRKTLKEFTIGHEIAGEKTSTHNVRETCQNPDQQRYFFRNHSPKTCCNVMFNMIRLAGVPWWCGGSTRHTKIVLTGIFLSVFNNEWYCLPILWGTFIIELHYLSTTKKMIWIEKYWILDFVSYLT